MTSGEDACKSCAIWVALVGVVVLWIGFLFIVFLGIIENFTPIVDMFNKKPIVFFIMPMCVLGAFSVIIFFKVISGTISITISRVVLSESASQIILWAILFLSFCGGSFIVWQLEYPSLY